MALSTPDIIIKKLMNLREAALYLFNDPKKVKALRTQIGKRLLNYTDIAGTFYVTKDDLREMIEQCRGNPKAHTSHGAKTPEPGSSGTETPTSAQDMARAKMLLLQPKKPSRNTSQASGRRKQTQPTNMISILQTS